MAEAAPAPVPAPAAPRKKPWALIAVVIVVILVIGGVTAYFVLPRGPAPRVIVYGVTSEMVTLDPSTEFSNSVLVLSNVYEALTKFDPDTQSAKPWLSTSWTKSSDSLNWTFTLRQGVKFHDGTPFNATAVKFSIERTIRMGQGPYWVWSFPVKAMHVEGEYQVRFELNYAAPIDWIASADYGAWIFSPNVPSVARDPDGTVNDTKLGVWFNDAHDSGTGPWGIVTEQYNKKERVVLARFSDYWGGWDARQFEFAVIRVMPDPAQREAAVREGDVDITIDVPAQDVPTLQGDSRVAVKITPSYRTMYAFFNNGRAPTNDPQVRQALAYAIPYSDILTTVMNDLGSQPIGVIPAGMWGHDPALPKYEFNLTKAEELLVAAGYGTKPRFTLELTYTAGDLFERGFAELYGDKLATLGITLDIKGIPWEQQWARAQAGPATAQDIFVMYWWPTYITPYDFLWGMFHSASYAYFNLGYYLNPTFDQTIDAAVGLEATDRPMALQIYSQAQAMLYQDAAAVGIVDLKNFYVMKSDLQGFKDNAAYPLVVFFYEYRR